MHAAFEEEGGPRSKFEFGLLLWEGRGSAGVLCHARAGGGNHLARVLAREHVRPEGLEWAQQQQQWECFVGAAHVTLVSAFVGGMSVSERYHNRRMMEDDARVALATLCRALSPLHQRGRVHGEVSPDTVAFPWPLHPTHVHLTHAGGLPHVLRPLSYARAMHSSSRTAAPELVAECRRERDGGGAVATWQPQPSLDVWDVGVVFHVLLSGMVPFADLDDAIHARLSFDHSRWKAVSFDAKSVLRKMLTADPQQRISLEELLAHPYLQGVVAQPDPPADQMDRMPYVPPPKEVIELPPLPPQPEVVAAEPPQKRAKSAETPQPQQQRAVNAAAPVPEATAPKKRERDEKDSSESPAVKAKSASPAAAPAALPKLTVAQLKKHRVDELRKMCKHRGLSDKGLKQELVDRLAEAML